MKLFATLKNEKHKVESLGGNELLTIEINRGNRRMVELYCTLDKIAIDKELMIIDLLDLRDGSTVRIYEYEVNSKLPEHKEKHKDNGHGYCTVKNCTMIHQNGKKCPSGHKQDADGRCPCVNEDAY